MALWPSVILASRREVPPWGRALLAAAAVILGASAFLGQSRGWLFATPVAYPSSEIPEPWKTWYGLNPMAGVVEGFRWSLLGSQPPGAMIWASAFAATTLLIGGMFYFKRMERTFSDIV